MAVEISNEAHVRLIWCLVVVLYFVVGLRYWALRRIRYKLLSPRGISSLCIISTVALTTILCGMITWNLVGPYKDVADQVLDVLNGVSASTMPVDMSAVATATPTSLSSSIAASIASGTSSYKPSTIGSFVSVATMPPSKRDEASDAAQSAELAAALSAAGADPTAAGDVSVVTDPAQIAALQSGGDVINLDDPSSTEKSSKTTAKATQTSGPTDSQSVPKSTKLSAADKAQQEALSSAVAAMGATVLSTVDPAVAMPTGTEAPVPTSSTDASDKAQQAALSSEVAAMGGTVLSTVSPPVGSGTPTTTESPSETSMTPAEKSEDAALNSAVAAAGGTVYNSDGTIDAGNPITTDSDSDSSSSDESDQQKINDILNAINSTGAVNSSDFQAFALPDGTEEHFATVFKVNFVSMAIFYLVIWLVKASFIVIYFEFDWDLTEGTRKFLYVASGLTMLSFAFVELVHLTWCLPIENNWDMTALIQTNSCRASLAPSVINSVMNVLTDLMVMCAGIAIIRSINLGRNDFRAASLIILIGCLTIVVAITRMVCLIVLMVDQNKQISSASNSTFNGKFAGTGNVHLPVRESVIGYPEVEAILAACATCLPALRVLFRKSPLGGTEKTNPPTYKTEDGFYCAGDTEKGNAKGEHALKSEFA